MAYELEIQVADTDAKKVKPMGEFIEKLQTQIVSMEIQDQQKQQAIEELQRQCSMATINHREDAERYQREHQVAISRLQNCQGENERQILMKMDWHQQQQGLLCEKIEMANE